MKSTRNLMIGVMVGGLLTAGSVWAGAPANGTVTIGNIVYLKDNSCFSMQYWPMADASCKALKSGTCGLTDGSKVGAWRLPNMNELRDAYNNRSSFVGCKNCTFWAFDPEDWTGSWHYKKNFFNGSELPGKEPCAILCVRGRQ